VIKASFSKLLRIVKVPISCLERLPVELCHLLGARFSLLQ